MSEASDLVSGLTPPNPLDQWAGRGPPLAVSPDLLVSAAKSGQAASSPQKPPDAAGSSFGQTPTGALIARDESGDRNIPNYSFDPHHTAGGHFQITDTNWRAYAPKVGIDVNQYPNAMSAPEQLQGQVAGKMYAEQGTMPWAPFNPKLAQDVHAQGVSWADEDRTKHQGAMDSSVAIQREMMRLASEELPGSKERQELLFKAREAADRASESFDQLRKTPPYYKPADIMENFGSAAVFISVLGGLFSRRPLTASLQAAGLAMQAQNQQRWDLFKSATDQWKTQADMGLAQSKLAHDQIREVVDDEKLAFNEREAKIHTLMSTWQIGEQARQHFEQNRENYMRDLNAHNDRLAEMTQRWQMHADTMQGAVAEKQKELELSSGLEAARASGDPKAVEAAQQKIADFNSARGKKSDVVAPGEKPSQSDIDYWTNVLRSGGSFPPYLGRSKAGQDLIKQVTMNMPHAGGTPGDFIANVGTVKADDSSLRNMTKMADAATSFERTASQNFDLALKLSHGAVPTDWGPWLNRWIMNGETQAGNKDVPPYVTAMLTGANEYAKIMSGSTGAQGSTVDSRREAAELFSPYLSAGQIDRVVAVAKADMGNRKQSLYGQIDDITARLRAAGSGEGSATRGQAPGKADTVSGAPSAAKRIDNQADYEALPVGAHYIGPDGQDYVKR
jgi:hypothetical protein